MAVATASSAAEAQVWVDMLLDEGILATAIEVGVHGALGGGGIMLPRVSILVNRADLDRARTVIAESGGAGALQPTQAQASAGRPLRSVALAVGIVLGLLLLIVAAMGGSR